MRSTKWWRSQSSFAIHWRCFPNRIEVTTSETNLWAMAGRRTNEVALLRSNPTTNIYAWTLNLADGRVPQNLNLIEIIPTATNTVFTNVICWALRVPTHLTRPHKPSDLVTYNSSCLTCSLTTIIGHRGFTVCPAITPPPRLIPMVTVHPTKPNSSQAQTLPMQYRCYASRLCQPCLTRWYPNGRPF